MSTIPSATPVVHIGIDVAKTSLQVDLQGSTARFANSPQGHREQCRGEEQEQYPVRPLSQKRHTERPKIDRRKANAGAFGEACS